MFVTHGPTAGAIFWLAIVIIVFMACFFSYRERESRHRMIETLAEKGQQIPPELLTNGRGYGSGWRYGNAIQSGIFMMCIGVALAVFLWALSGDGNVFEGSREAGGLPFVGIFPFMVGLARLLAGILERRPAK
jgi:Domain of unknown function (DUF6249)